MTWNIEFNEVSERQLRKLDRQWREKILKYLLNEIVPLADPRLRGKPLVGDKRGFWRYRVGDYRVICKIEDGQLLILVVEIGHRREVY